MIGLKIAQYKLARKTAAMLANPQNEKFLRWNL
jgi:hypothetical protein